MADVEINVDLDGATRAREDLEEIRDSMSRLGDTSKKTSDDIEETTKSVDKNKKAIDSLNKSLKPLTKAIDGTIRPLKGLTIAIGAGAVAIASYREEIVSLGAALGGGIVRTSLNSFRDRIDSISQTSDRSMRRQEALRKTINRVGADFLEVSGSVGKLTAALFEQDVAFENTRKTVRGFLQSQLNLGVSSKDAASNLDILTESAKSGEISLSDLRQSLNFLNDPLGFLANSFNTTEKAIKNAMAEGKQLSVDVLPEIAKRLRDTSEVDRGLTEGLNRLKNAFVELMQRFNEAGAMDAIIRKIKEFNENLDDRQIRSFAQTLSDKFITILDQLPDKFQTVIDSINTAIDRLAIFSGATVGALTGFMGGLALGPLGALGGAFVGGTAGGTLGSFLGTGPTFGGPSLNFPDESGQVTPIPGEGGEGGGGEPVRLPPLSITEKPPEPSVFTGPKATKQAADFNKVIEEQQRLMVRLFDEFQFGDKTLAEFNKEMARLEEISQGVKRPLDSMAPTLSNLSDRARDFSKAVGQEMLRPLSSLQDTARDVGRTLKSSLSDTFAAALKNSKSFADEMEDIFERMKDRLIDIFAQIATNSLIRQVVGLLGGAQSGFAVAGGGAASGGGGGSGGLLSSLGGGGGPSGTIRSAGSALNLIGGTGGGSASGAALGANVSGGLAPIQGFGSAGASGGALGSLGSAASLAGGGLSIAGGGFLAGNILGDVTGLSGAPGAAAGAAAGAGVGAGLGTAVFPGIGTAIGAGIGALAGLFGGGNFFADDVGDTEFFQVSTGQRGRDTLASTFGPFGRVTIPTGIPGEDISGERDQEEFASNIARQVRSLDVELARNLDRGQQQAIRQELRSRPIESPEFGEEPERGAEGALAEILRRRAARSISAAGFRVPGTLQADQPTDLSPQAIQRNATQFLSLFSGVNNQLEELSDTSLPIENRIEAINNTMKEQIRIAKDLGASEEQLNKIRKLGNERIEEINRQRGVATAGLKTQFPDLFEGDITRETRIKAAGLSGSPLSSIIKNAERGNKDKAADKVLDLVSSREVSPEKGQQALSVIQSLPEPDKPSDQFTPSDQFIPTEGFAPEGALRPGGIDQSDNITVVLQGNNVVDEISRDRFEQSIERGVNKQKKREV